MTIQFEKDRNEYEDKLKNSKKESNKLMERIKELESKETQNEPENGNEIELYKIEIEKIKKELERSEKEINELKNNSNNNLDHKNSLEKVKQQLIEKEQQITEFKSFAEEKEKEIRNLKLEITKNITESNKQSGDQIEELYKQIKISQNKEIGMLK